MFRSKTFKFYLCSAQYHPLMKMIFTFGLLLVLFACKEEIPAPVKKAYISSPKAVLTEIIDSAVTIPGEPFIKAKTDSVVYTDDHVFIMLPPVSVRESFDVVVRENGERRKIKVNYEIGKDTTREYAQIYNQLEIRFFPEIPLDLSARVESYVSRYKTMNTMVISPLFPMVNGNLFSFNLEKLQEDKVFNLVIYEEGKKVHSISFEKYDWRR